MLSLGPLAVPGYFPDMDHIRELAAQDFPGWPPKFPGSMTPSVYTKQLNLRHFPLEVKARNRVLQISRYYQPN
jgi:hypothetical protein